ncbi:helix-turn-helix domain-containing protein [Pseudomonas sp. AU10]|uniref:helix-turn-helix domain-containing protein n=1 Tax=Pseudomonas sp. AU10 TaxID=882697 RepID=UPI002114AEFE|nr:MULTISPECIES: helix-turn-helix domain-containing protein [unclassified Pseudomonas]
MKLTLNELAIITAMHQNTNRVTSKSELIKCIGRPVETYKGIEMCLSRLQKKFKKLNGGRERLFRSVRNRGYCLVQVIIKN